MVGRNDSSAPRKRASIEGGPSHSGGSPSKRPTTDSSFGCGETSANFATLSSSNNNHKGNGLCRLRFTLDFASDTLRKVVKQGYRVYSPPTYFEAAPTLAWRLLLSWAEDEERGSRSPSPDDSLGLYLACHTCSTRAYDDGCDEENRCHPGWLAEVENCDLRICSQVRGAPDVFTTASPFSKVFSNGLNHSWEHDSRVSLDWLLNKSEDLFKDDTLVFAATFTIGHIHIPSSSSTASTITTFFEPGHASNDIIFSLDGWRRVHANKGILAVYSPYFAAMFRNDMAERQMQEIRLKGVEYGELVELLLIIYPSQKPIDAYNVEFVLKLADRFLMASLIERCEEFLLNGTGNSNCRKRSWYKRASPRHWPISKRLYIGQTFSSLAEYKRKCYASLCAGELIKLREETGYQMLDENTRATIADSVKLEAADYRHERKGCFKCGRRKCYDRHRR